MSRPLTTVLETPGARLDRPQSALFQASGALIAVSRNRVCSRSPRTMACAASCTLSFGRGPACVAASLAQALFAVRHRVGGLVAIEDGQGPQLAAVDAPAVLDGKNRCQPALDETLRCLAVVNVLTTDLNRRSTEASIDALDLKWRRRVSDARPSSACSARSRPECTHQDSAARCRTPARR
mgnify:CR=1 FL=1